MSEVESSGQQQEPKARYTICVVLDSHKDADLQGHTRSRLIGAVGMPACRSSLVLWGRVCVRRKRAGLVQASESPAAALVRAHLLKTFEVSMKGNAEGVKSISDMMSDFERGSSSIMLPSSLIAGHRRKYSGSADYE